MAIERRVRIVQDDAPFNPRKEWDCWAGRMYCWHSRYSLGDEHSYDVDDFLKELACEHDADLEEYVERLGTEVWDKLYDRAADNGCEGWEECQAYAERFVRKRIDARIEKAISDGYVMLPLYLYDHSGITMNTGGFSCSWDSGQVGWIVCDIKTVEKEFEGDRDRAKKSLEAKVEVYDQYLTGDVWGFIAEKREIMDRWNLADDEGWEEDDSCWGFFGSDPEISGMADHLGADYADALTKAVQYT